MENQNTVGLMARTVKDAATIHSVIAGIDPNVLHSRKGLGG